MLNVPANDEKVSEKKVKNKNILYRTIIANNKPLQVLKGISLMLNRSRKNNNKKRFVEFASHFHGNEL